MKHTCSLRLALAVTGGLLTASASHAQVAFGVDSLGNLFSLNVSAPASTTTIANLGFVPEGIDFRTGTSSLFAIDVGASTAQLYTIDVGTGAATAIGGGFATAGTVGGVSYNLAGATSFGFDFNPTTLQADGSIRIRFTANNGTNLRLHSATGGVAAVDGPLAGSVGAVAYINNVFATQGGVTGLYDIDYQSDSLLFQNPPNAGTLNLIGSLGVDVGSNLGFDILSAVGGDAGIAGDFAFLVDTLAPGSATLYSVNLGTGAAAEIGLVGRDFTGGFALASPVPEPAHFGLGAAAVLLGFAAWRRRKVPSAS
jgi:hypothetical protein